MNDLIDKPLVVVGNSLAVLVAATERAHKGLPTVVVAPGKGLGGYFSGVEVHGKLRDAGMVLYEFSSFREPAREPGLDTYNPMKRNDIGRFCAVVRAYVQRNQRTRSIGVPQMWTQGRMLDDMMLGNGISSVRKLANASTIRSELAEVVQRVRADTSIYHPANKSAWPVAGEEPADWHLGPGRNGLRFDCDSVSRVVHGEMLHETLFEGFSRQVMNRDAAHLSALYHRLPWLPLYWPETLLAELDGKAMAMQPTRISSPDGEPVAAFCRRLANEVRQSPLVSLVEDSVTSLVQHANGFRIRLRQHGEMNAARVAWALTPGQGVSAAGGEASSCKGSRLPLALGFFDFPESELVQQHGFVHAISSDVGCYRVTNSTLNGSVTEEGIVSLVVEANPEHMLSVHGSMKDDRALLNALQKDIARMGIVKDGAVAKRTDLRTFDGALPLPTHEAVESFIYDQSCLLRLCPSIELLGASAAPFAMGLSDQIVQGLQLADRADLPSTRAVRCIEATADAAVSAV